MRTALAALALLTLTSCGTAYYPAEPVRDEDPYAELRERGEGMVKDGARWLQEKAEDLDLPTIEVKTDSKPAYDRDAFGSAWYDVDQNGCSTRDDILAAELQDLVVDEDGCAVLAGTYYDLYTDETYEYERGRSVLDLDHLVPLSWAWDRGAWRWSEAERIAFANDEQNLRLSYMGANRSKGDQGPSEWLPPNSAYRCTYVGDFLSVAHAYGLRVKPAERAQAC